MLTWKEVNGAWYCYKNGAMVKGWVQDESNRSYHLNDKDGKMDTGWIQLNSKWYYFYPKKIINNGVTYAMGEMATGWINLDARWYYLYTQKTVNYGITYAMGAMAVDWAQIDSRWYYFYTQKTEKDGNTHYKGEMAIGWIQLNSRWYYLYPQKTVNYGITYPMGAMALDWVQINSKWYYLYTEKDGSTHYKGEMAINTTIDGWTIDSSGVATLASHTGSMTDNAKYIYSFFRARGWTSNSICGLLGNMQGESGIVADMDEKGGGGGYGLVQWTPKSILTNWANQNGLDYRTVETQCKRIQCELENGQQFYATSAYPMNFPQFTQSTDSPTYLAKVFINNYERPANNIQPQRGVWAENWYSILA